MVQKYPNRLFKLKQINNHPISNAKQHLMDYHASNSHQQHSYSHQQIIKLKSINNHDLKIILPLVVLILQCTLINCHTNQIRLQQTKKISFQIDQSFSQSIPLYYDLYQLGKIVNFTHYNQKSSSYQKIPNNLCKIQPDTQNSYIPSQKIFHYGISDPQKYFIGDKKIYHFKDLKKLNGVLDSVVFNGNIFVMFQNGYYTVSQIEESGHIRLKQVNHIRNPDTNASGSKLSNSIQLSYGHFIQPNEQQYKNYLLFFAEEHVLIMNSTSKIFQLVQGYQPIGYQFQKAIIEGNKIYVACSKRGILVYEIDFQMSKMQIEQEFLAVARDSQQIEEKLEVTDLVFDNKGDSKRLIVVDQEQGIFWIPIPQTNPPSNVSISVADTQSLLIQKCTNLHIFKQHKTIALTCPQIVLINLQTRSHSIIQQIDFQPRDMVLNQSRIILFGEYRYAVYDIEQKIISRGQSSLGVEFVLIQNQWIVTVNKYQIAAGVIEPGFEMFSCLSSSQRHKALVGKNRASFVIQGVCSQLFYRQYVKGKDDYSQLAVSTDDNLFLPNLQDGQRIMGAINKQQNCLLIYPLEIELIDSSIISYLIEFVVAGIIVWTALVGTIYYFFKYNEVKREYQTLEQEATMVGDKKQGEQVLSAKGNQGDTTNQKEEASQKQQSFDNKQN